MSSASASVTMLDRNRRRFVGHVPRLHLAYKFGNAPETRGPGLSLAMTNAAWRSALFEPSRSLGFWQQTNCKIGLLQDLTLMSRISYAMSKCSSHTVCYSDLISRSPFTRHHSGLRHFCRTVIHSSDVNMLLFIPIIPRRRFLTVGNCHRIVVTAHHCKMKYLR